MVFNAGDPAAGIAARQLDNDIRLNNDFLVTALNFGHNFTTPNGTGWHKEGSAQIYSGPTPPTLKEDGVTALTSVDFNQKLWINTTTDPGIVNVYTAASTWTPLMQLLGMLDEDDLISDSDVLPATQQSIKKYVDEEQLLDLKLVGGTMSGVIDMGDNLISNVTDPVSAQDVATKAYIDAFNNIERVASTYTGDQNSANNSDMSNAQSITGIGFNPQEVTIYSEVDSDQTFVKTDTMGLTDAMGLGNNVYTDLVIEFISDGFKVNRRSSDNNQTCNDDGVTYHFVAKRYS